MKSILIDFGGTIARDNLLFQTIAIKSGNFNPPEFSPDNWDRIETVGSSNYFDISKKSFFEMSKFYFGFSDFIKKYNAISSSSKTQTIVVFDDKPNLKMNGEQIQFALAKKLADENCSPNSIYIESDKISLCKKMGVSFAIDDDPRVALALAAAGIKTFLISRLWNRRFDFKSVDLLVPAKKKETIQKNLAVVDDWVEISELIVV
jgi:hypothetical protein